MARRGRTRSRRRGVGWPVALVAVILVGGAALAFVPGGSPVDEDLRALGDRLRRAVTQAAGPGGADGPPPPPGATPSGQASGDPALGGLVPALTPDEAAAALAALTIGPETLPGTPDYDRDDFGGRWQDVDGNDCNQRDDVLLRDARPGSALVEQRGGCRHDVVAGSWTDPSTGVLLTFDDLKAPGQSEALQIDHVVPLAEAHRSGASAWSPEQRAAFANDLSGLVAAEGPTNAEKGDSDPGQWRPRDESAWCAYALVWIAAKDEWSLSVDAGEVAALEDMLARC